MEPMHISGVMRVCSRPVQAQGRQNPSMEGRGGQEVTYLEEGVLTTGHLPVEDHISKNIRAAQTELDEVFFKREGLWSERSWRRGEYHHNTL